MLKVIILSGLFRIVTWLASWVWFLLILGPLIGLYRYFWPYSVMAANRRGHNQLAWNYAENRPLNDGH